MKVKPRRKHRRYLVERKNYSATQSKRIRNSFMKVCFSIALLTIRTVLKNRDSDQVNSRFKAKGKTTKSTESTNGRYREAKQGEKFKVRAQWLPVFKSVRFSIFSKFKKRSSWSSTSGWDSCLWLATVFLASPSFGDQDQPFEESVLASM